VICSNDAPECHLILGLATLQSVNKKTPPDALEHPAAFWLW
jgi:hypothetical protein